MGYTCWRRGCPMRMKFFGDSFDIVKKQMLAWLGTGGRWAVQPMFTEQVVGDDAQAFARFLGAQLLNSGVFTRNVDRGSFLGTGDRPWNVFFDPDTGIAKSAKSANFLRSPQSYLLIAELVQLAHERPEFLTLVFDKSVPRGSERKAEEEKLDAFRKEGVAGLAYIGQAPFVALSCNPNNIQVAARSLVTQSKLPQDRIIVSE